MAIHIENIIIYLPALVLTNEVLAGELKVSPDEIFKKTGIKQRYISAPDEISSDIAENAANKLFTEAGVDKNSIDFLIFCSEGFDYIAPPTSCILQHKLNLPETMGCFDLPYGCSGYLYGLMLANSLLESGTAKKILFLTGDIPSKVVENDNLELRSIFSDIGTANLLTLDRSKPSTVFNYGTDGKGAFDLYVERSASRNPPDAEFLHKTNLPIGRMIMNGTNVFLFAMKRVPGLVKETLEKNKLSINDVDLFIFHQANSFLLEVLRKKIKIPAEKFFTNIESYGNSTSSSIPVALKDAEQQGKLKRGMKVLLAGFGIGNSWAATIIDY